MRPPRRVLRRQRQQTRRRWLPGLNLVALMDIFTILVFFLLVNSSEVQELPSTKAVQLPESIVDAKPRETVIVMVTQSDVLLQGEVIGSVEAVLAHEDRVFVPLQQALERQAQRALSQPQGADKGEVTILGDKATPYRVLQKVMQTCTEAGFGRVSLAVVQKPVAGG
jgi:biopolymer transport protein ExbD